MDTDTAASYKINHMTATDKKTILIVEDENKLAEVMKDFLDHAGYNNHILHNGNQVIDWVKLKKPDLMLLDLMLPGKDGLDICREVRQFSNLPIIITTAKIEEIDRLLGLELGADDYVCKPYSPREVVARIKAQLRRVEMLTARAQPTTNKLLLLDADRLKVIHNNNELELTSIEYALLEVMYNSPGRIFSRDKLMDRIYQDSRIVSDRTIDSHIKKLRHKLANLIPKQELVHSVYGVGYRYEEPLPT
jgi:two-component system response regulator BaeR